MSTQPPFSHQEPIPAQQPIGYFDPFAPLSRLDGNLPHFGQTAVSYFCTFRTADSLPLEKRNQWQAERDIWLKNHPEPHSLETRMEYAHLFPDRIQQWLDAGFGDCALACPDVRKSMVDTMLHFQGSRHVLKNWVVMPNHVHVVITPLGDHELSQILHSWKTFTARRINQRLNKTGPFWQKESYDHIVRSPGSLTRLEAYIQENPKGLKEGTFSLCPSVENQPS